MNFEKITDPEERGGENDLEEQEQLKLTPALQAIADMDLHFSPEEYKDKAFGGQDILSLEVSEDAFLRIVKKLIDGGRDTQNSWSAMLNILERDSMKGHPQIEIFKQAVKDIAERKNKKLRLAEDYWDNIK